MRILVTGATGFVGSALVRRLRADGHEVLAVGRRPSSAAGYLQCDLSRGLETPFCPEVVVHAAARSSPWGSRAEFELHNVQATEQVVRFCESHGRPFLIHVSTCAVMYTRAHQIGMDESTPLPRTSINTYAATKRQAELVVGNYSGASCILRPRAIFGPGDTVLFPRILRAARKGSLPIIESSEPVMVDLIYIDTFVDYILRALERRVTGLYVVTNKHPVILIEFLLGLLDQLALPRPTRRVPVSRAMAAAAMLEWVYAALPFLGEPPITRFGVSTFAYSKTFNVSKALRDLGPPSVSLEDGVRRFVDWQKRQRD
ncbi:NAD-dependent epimerase/dehydratase family protein [Nibricoccus sp. IMCC34717]|uniref:NAD-dependent epimerase/dehydratase family protein n=1 Tax=Nibricoccus sp. IMCC34717 TaxID=3034021 RepID=UPI00384E0DEC